MSFSGVASNVSLVVFDMDGVLVDTTPCHRRAYESLWNHLGIAGPAYEAIAGRRTVDVVREFAAEQVSTDSQIEQLVDLKQEAARALLASEPIVFDDSERTVRRLADSGFALALGTGASRRGVSIVLDRLACASLFEAIVTADDVSRGKPDPEVFERACTLSGHDPEEALVIEDSFQGIEAGLSAGCYVVAVRSKIDHAAQRFLGTFPNLDETVDALTGAREAM